jgi:Fe2+ or Zn2+ uptake regulation protein
MPTLLHETEKRLHARGGRMTTQRRLILEILNRLDCHPTAEELFDQAHQQDPTLHLSTVYRTLRWLETEGLIQSRYFGEDRMERFDSTRPEEHYHFVCTSCDLVIEFNTLLVQAIKAQFELHSGAQVETGSVVLYGLCPECRKRE